MSRPYRTGLPPPRSLALDASGVPWISVALPVGPAILKTSIGKSPLPSLIVPLLPAADHTVADSARNRYAADGDSASIHKVSGGTATLFASSLAGDGAWEGPAGLAIGNTGALYVADMDDLRKITTP